MEVRRRVAVIGAGPGGLGAVKSCLEEGLEPVCFEQRDAVGGIWNIREEQDPVYTDVAAMVYSSCITNCYKGLASFSDYQSPKEYPMYLQSRQFQPFLQGYANEFDLMRHIRLNTQVVKVSKSDDYVTTGRWTVTSRQLTPDNNSPAVTEEYDGVVICIGCYNRPYFPYYPGLESFKGLKMHGGSYFNADKFKDKNVLVIGGALSGAEMAVEISRVAKQVYLNSRNGLLIIPRLLFGVPFEMLTLSRFQFETKSMNSIFKSGHQLLTSMLPYKDFSMQPNHELGRGDISICSDMEYRIAAGYIKMMPTIESFGPTSVKFTDGKTVDNLDAILFTTGFINDCTFLEDPDASAFPEPDHSTLRLFKEIFPPSMTHTTLAYIGKQDSFGPFLPALELQARVVARVFSGQLALPSNEQMAKEAEAEAEWKRARFGKNTTRCINYRLYDELAKFLGAKPTMSRILLMFFYDPVLAWNVLFGPSIPPTFRLFGPHSKWEQARAAILSDYDNTFYPSRTITYQQVATPFYFRRSFLVPALIAGGVVLRCCFSGKVKIDQILPERILLLLGQ